MTCLRPGPAAAVALTLLVALSPARAEGPARKPAGEQVALLVGVRKYDPNELRDLPYAEADVEGLAKALRAAGYPSENVVVMTQSAAARRRDAADHSGQAALADALFSQAGLQPAVFSAF